MQGANNTFARSGTEHNVVGSSLSGRKEDITRKEKTRLSFAFHSKNFVHDFIMKGYEI